MEYLNLALTDYTDTASKVNLVSGVFRLLRGTFIPKPGTGSGSVIDVIDLVSEAGNDAIVAELARIETMFELARTWRTNPLQSGGVWLEWGIDAEPRVSAEVGYPAKRAWVYGGEIEIMNVRGMPGALLNGRVFVRLAIRRHAAFENLEEVSDSETSIGWGDVIDLTGLQAEKGTLPGRIRRALVYETTTGQYMAEFWLGIRPENIDPQSVTVLWELEAGTNGTDTSNSSDATASDGSKKTCSFATETGLDARVTITPYQAAGAGYCSELAGRYLILLRCKVGSSTECGILMRHGSATDYGLTASEPVYIDNTSWKLVELGEVTIPAQGYRDEFSIDIEYAIRKFTIRIDAERLSGSGSLDLDALYLIPADHFIHVRYPATPSEVYMMEGITLPDDDLNLHLWELANDAYIFGEQSARDWVIPLDIGIAVVAGQKATEHVLTHDHNLYLYWVPRWSGFRAV